MDGGLANLNHSEKARIHLPLDFGEESVSLVASHFSAIDSKIQRIPDFQKRKRGEENWFCSALGDFPCAFRGSLRGEIKGNDESGVSVGHDS
jgi:hypothetical protein